MKLKAKQWKYLKQCWHLTPREREVAELVCIGFDNVQISKRLHIAYNTVRAHLANIFHKMGVRRKSGMILQFLEVLEKSRI